MSEFLSRVLPYIKEDFNVRKAVGLFPTVERMAQSPNGQRLGKLLAVSSLYLSLYLLLSLSFSLSLSLSLSPSSIR